MSVAVTKNVTGIPEVLLVFMVIFKSPARTGGVVSDGASKLTVTVKLTVPTFPAASLAVHVTVVVPIGNKKPEDGEQVGAEVPTREAEGLKLIL